MMINPPFHPNIKSKIASPIFTNQFPIDTEMEPSTDHWNTCFSNGSFSNEDAEFMANILGNSSLCNESSSGFSSAFWATDDSITPTYPNDLKFQMYPSSDVTNTNNIFSSSYSQDNSFGTDESYYLNESTHQSSSFSFGLMNNNNSRSCIDFCFGENKTNENSIEQAHTKELSMPQISDNIMNYCFIESSNKRTRTSSDHVDIQNEKKRNVKPTKNPNVKINYNINRQSSKTSSCGCSEGDDENTDNNNSKSLSLSQSQSESIGKGKGSRGSAGDPQSLYARKRREKINERLRILQSLVPNGTKVDISTMLEEAVQYVKFLQLQIKLLSSDDMWMYAPIAYNGMGIGIDMSIPIPKSTATSL